MSKITDTKISTSEVEHIAKLARIELDEKDKKTFSTQLTEILQYIKKLEEVDTDDVEPTAHVTQLKNIMRHDKAKTCVGQADLIKAAPASQDNCIKVKAVLK
ncbi:MAG: Asp-tRNA(Asn)/Glu-tRNA(Gln) amidotransferase subunit GatC [Parcubacteria group bacterium]|nr:Asp-tRNA(Asn)/Glu-tRNA(Gln) amidotransferase subunit GatC [Parcubacteria group bacterium]